MPRCVCNCLPNWFISLLANYVATVQSRLLDGERMSALRTELGDVEGRADMLAGTSSTLVTLFEDLKEPPPPPPITMPRKRALDEDEGTPSIVRAKRLRRRSLPSGWAPVTAEKEEDSVGEKDVDTSSWAFAQTISALKAKLASGKIGLVT